MSKKLIALLLLVAAAAAAYFLLVKPATAGSDTTKQISKEDQLAILDSRISYFRNISAT